MDWNETYFRIDDFDTFTGVAVQKTAIVSEMDTADTAMDTSLVKYKGIDYLADVDKAEVEILKAARKKLRDCFDNELVEKGDFVNMIVAEQKINSMVEIRGAAFDDFKLRLTKATVDDELSEQIKGVTTKDLYKMVEETKLFDRAYGPIKKFEKVETPKTDELRANMLEKIDAMRDNYGGVVKLKTLEHQEVVDRRECLKVLNSGGNRAFTFTEADSKFHELDGKVIKYGVSCFRDTDVVCSDLDNDQLLGAIKELLKYEALNYKIKYDQDSKPVCRTLLRLKYELQEKL